MKSNHSWRVRLAQILLGAVIVIALVVVRGTKAGNDPVHLTTDWSHRHLVFSPPHNLMEQFKLSSNVRYVQQWVRRNAEKNGGDPEPWRWRRAPEPPANGTPNLMHRDWGVYLGSGGTVGANSYPAKYSFDTTSANCATDPQPDFVVYNTSLTPTAAGAGATATETGFTSTTSVTGILTITNNNLPAPNNTLVLFPNNSSGTAAAAAGHVTVNSTPHSGDTVTAGPITYTFETAGLTAQTDEVFAGANAAAAAGNLEAAINDNSAQCVSTAPCFASGIIAPNPTDTATVAGAQVNIAGIHNGAAGNFSETSGGGRLSSTVTTTGGGAGLNTDVNAGPNFFFTTPNSAGNVDAAAVNLAAAITRSGASIGVTASATGANGNVTVTSLNSGADTTGGLVDIGLASTLGGFTLNHATLAGGTTGASIVAYDNLYSGCTGTVPSVYWAFDTGGTAVTSPTLSGDGTQVAFVENIGTTGTLVLMKWAAASGTVDAPTNISTAGTTTNNVSNANYRACTAPCMTEFSFGTGNTDMNSPPFYDFADDVIYVGDDTGHIRRYDNVFKGTPVAHGGGYPVAVTNTGVLTGPLFDEGSGKVFVASASGFVNVVTASTGAEFAVSSHIAGTGGIFDTPILDPSTGNLYVITSDSNIGTSNDSAIYTFSTGFTSASGENGTETIFSANNPGTAVYSGTFDQLWFSGAATGHMYVCGSAALDATPTLYQISVNPATGVLGAVSTGPALATTAAPFCSPVTEFYNATTSVDSIYVSVTDLGQTASPVDCATNYGCLMSFNVTAGTAITTSTATTATIPVGGGASGVIIDNSVASGTLAGASQVYYAPLGYESCATTPGAVGGCAVQASQAGLN